MSDSHQNWAPTVIVAGAAASMMVYGVLKARGSLVEFENLGTSLWNRLIGAGDTDTDILNNKIKSTELMNTMNTTNTTLDGNILKESEESIVKKSYAANAHHQERYYSSFPSVFYQRAAVRKLFAVYNIDRGDQSQRYQFGNFYQQKKSSPSSIVTDKNGIDTEWRDNRAGISIFFPSSVLWLVHEERQEMDTHLKFLVSSTGVGAAGGGAAPLAQQHYGEFNIVNRGRLFSGEYDRFCGILEDGGEKCDDVQGKEVFKIRHKDDTKKNVRICNDDAIPLSNDFNANRDVMRDYDNREPCPMSALVSVDITITAVDSELVSDASEIRDQFLCSLGSEMRILYTGEIRTVREPIVNQSTGKWCSSAASHSKDPIPLHLASVEYCYVIQHSAELPLSGSCSSSEKSSAVGGLGASKSDVSVASSFFRNMHQCNNKNCNFCGSSVRNTTGESNVNCGDLNSAMGVSQEDEERNNYCIGRGTVKRLSSSTLSRVVVSEMRHVTCLFMLVSDWTVMFRLDTVYPRSKTIPSWFINMAQTISFSMTGALVPRRCALQVTSGIAVSSTATASNLFCCEPRYGVGFHVPISFTRVPIPIGSGVVNNIINTKQHHDVYTVENITSYFFFEGVENQTDPLWNACMISSGSSLGKNLELISQAGVCATSSTTSVHNGEVGVVVCDPIKSTPSQLPLPSHVLVSNNVPLSGSFFGEQNCSSDGGRIVGSVTSSMMSRYIAQMTMIMGLPAIMYSNETDTLTPPAFTSVSASSEPFMTLQASFAVPTSNINNNFHHTNYTCNPPTVANQNPPNYDNNRITIEARYEHYNQRSYSFPVVLPKVLKRVAERFRLSEAVIPFTFDYHKNTESDSSSNTKTRERNKNAIPTGNKDDNTSPNEMVMRPFEVNNAFLRPPGAPRSNMYGLSNIPYFHPHSSDRNTSTTSKNKKQDEESVRIIAAAEKELLIPDPDMLSSEIHMRAKAVSIGTPGASRGLGGGDGPQDDILFNFYGGAEEAALMRGCGVPLSGYFGAVNVLLRPPKMPRAPRELSDHHINRHTRQSTQNFEENHINEDFATSSINGNFGVNVVQPGDLAEDTTAIGGLSTDGCIDGLLCLYLVSAGGEYMSFTFVAKKTSTFKMKSLLELSSFCMNTLGTGNHYGQEPSLHYTHLVSCGVASTPFSVSVPRGVGVLEPLSGDPLAVFTLSPELLLQASSSASRSASRMVPLMGGNKAPYRSHSRESSGTQNPKDKTSCWEGIFSSPPSSSPSSFSLEFLAAFFSSTSHHRLPPLFSPFSPGSLISLRAFPCSIRVSRLHYSQQRKILHKLKQQHEEDGDSSNNIIIYSNVNKSKTKHSKRDKKGHSLKLQHLEKRHLRNNLADLEARGALLLSPEAIDFQHECMRLIYSLGSSYTPFDEEEDRNGEVHGNGNMIHDNTDRVSLDVRDGARPQESPPYAEDNTYPNDHKRVNSLVGREEEGPHLISPVRIVIPNPTGGVPGGGHVEIQEVRTLYCKPRGQNNVGKFGRCGSNINNKKSNSGVVAFYIIHDHDMEKLIVNEGNPDGQHICSGKSGDDMSYSESAVPGDTDGDHSRVNTCDIATNEGSSWSCDMSQHGLDILKDGDATEASSFNPFNWILPPPAPVCIQAQAAKYLDIAVEVRERIMSASRGGSECGNVEGITDDTWDRVMRRISCVICVEGTAFVLQGGGIRKEFPAVKKAVLEIASSWV